MSRLAVPLILIAGVACGGEPPDLSRLNDVVPPEILTVSPPAGADNVPVTATVTILFSEPVDPATVTAATVSLNAPEGSVGGELSVEGSLVTLRPVVPLQAQTTFRAVVQDAVRDLAGNRLPAGMEWSFTTRQGVFTGARQSSP